MSRNKDEGDVERDEEECEKGIWHSSLCNSYLG